MSFGFLSALPFGFSFSSSASYPLPSSVSPELRSESKGLRRINQLDQADLFLFLGSLSIRKRIMYVDWEGMEWGRGERAGDSSKEFIRSYSMNASFLSHFFPILLRFWLLSYLFDSLTSAQVLDKWSKASNYSQEQMTHSFILPTSPPWTTRDSQSIFLPHLLEIPDSMAITPHCLLWNVMRIGQMHRSLSDKSDNRGEIDLLCEEY